MKEIKQNFEITETTKQVTFKSKISIPLDIIKLINELDQMFIYDENIYENSKLEDYIKNIKIEIGYYKNNNINEKYSIYPQHPKNKIIVYKKNTKIDDNDIYELKKIIIKTLEIYEGFLNSDIKEHLGQIERINLGLKCTKCKYFVVCDNETFADNAELSKKECFIHRHHYNNQNKFSKPFNKEYDLTRFEIKLNLLKRIEEIKKTFGCEYLENYFLTKELTEEKVKFYLENDIIEKTKYFTKEW